MQNTIALKTVMSFNPPAFCLVMAVLAVISYFFGSFNGAIIISKYILHDDIRNHGSGNGGLTNFYRTFGGPLTAVVILTDMLKGVITVIIATFVARSLPMPEGTSPELISLIIPPIKFFGALFCMLGHMFPYMFGFKGGKGILTGGAMIFFVDWHIALVVWGGFLILAILTKFVSLGSISVGFSLPVSTWCIFKDPIMLFFGAVIGGLLIFMHRSNIGRLLSGTESKFTFRKKKS